MTDPTSPDQAPQPPQPQVPWQDPAPPPGAPQPPPGWPPPQQPPTSWTGPAAEPGPAPGIRFASHGPRLVAYIIDTIIISIFLIVAITVLSITFFGSAWLTGLRNEDFTGRPSDAAIATIVGFTFLVLFLGLVSFLYFPFFWARSGQTPGMRPFNLHVVRDSDGGKISGGQAILRLFGYWVSAVVFYLGFIWIFIDKRRRGWMDLLGGTVVVAVPPAEYTS
jgi:uncharacterized RDD family membrane protein YckC